MYHAPHAKPRTRALHYLGAFLGVASLGVVEATGDWCWLPAAPVAATLSLGSANSSSSTTDPRASDTRTGRSSATYGCSPFSYRSGWIGG